MTLPSEQTPAPLVARIRHWWRQLVGPVGHETLVPLPLPLPPPRPVPAEVVCRVEAPEPVLVPAQGDAFDFHVHPVYRWTARNMSYEELRHRADGFLGWAGSIVRDQAADIARRYEPHRSHDMEQALNAHLTDQSWPRTGDAPRLTIQVRVRPDGRVRERLRPYWEERIGLECEHELARLRARQARELTDHWREVLRALEDDPVTRHAARLTEQQFAHVFGEYADERRRVPMELAELLRDALSGHRDLGLGPSEYTEAWDAAIRAHQRQYGLTVEST